MGAINVAIGLKWKEIMGMTIQLKNCLLFCTISTEELKYFKRQENIEVFKHF